MVSIQDILNAQERQRQHLRVTPVVELDVSEFTDAQVHLKLENLQRTGSFKEHGAINKLLQLKEAQGTSRGIIASSAGNHAQAMAHHAKRLGFPATIVMPVHTPLNKIVATERWGADVRLEGETFDQAVAAGKRIAQEKNLTFVHAFDDPQIIAGQGTVGLEIMEQAPDIEAIAVPVGGGGLASGIAIAAKHINPDIKVFGVQVENYCKATLAYKGINDISPSKHPLPTLAEGIAIKGVGDVTLPLIKEYLDDMFLVSEDEIADAVLYLLEYGKLTAEGAGAAALAALMADKLPYAISSWCLPICGGNIDLNIVSRIIEKGLVKTQRLVQMDVVVLDRPGGLNQLTTTLAREKANILQIQHHRASAEIPIYDTGTRLMLEVRGPDHAERILKCLCEAGFEATLVE